MNYLTFSRLERSGRLGNQCFQIASTVGLARRHGYEPRFPTTWSYRNFFNMTDEWYADMVATESYWLNDLDHIPDFARIYMQDLSLFAHCADEIRKIFELSPAGKAMVDSVHVPHLPNCLAVHVRRGDNVYQQANYPLPSIDYYRTAVDAHPGMDVVLYSDDPMWCDFVLRPALSPRNVFLHHGVPRPKEHEPQYDTAPVLDWIDMALMARHHSFVLSNSTMGLFAAWLADSTDVTVPDPWYGPALGGAVDPRLMFLPSWKEAPSDSNQTP